ncbi:MAG: hypothetical protein ACI4EG_00870 [Fusicatenibacter sp.]
MRKRWEEPQILVQEFIANEYIAACVVGNIQCALPGRSSTEQDDGTTPIYTEPKTHLQHGLCGETAPISFDSDTASGYEVINGVKQTNRPIYDISGYTLEPGTYLNVTWKSTDNGGKDEYSHTGRLVITNIDENRPNHS